MNQRQLLWRQHLMGNDQDIAYKRVLYTKFILNSNNIEHQLKGIIQRDMPRTYPRNTWVQHNIKTIQQLLIEYASIPQGDGYLQGFNFLMAITYKVFKGTTHEREDTSWCFSRIIGLVRPLIPDFNSNWFHWSRNYWVNHLLQKLSKKRPQLHSILLTNQERFSVLSTCKWFMLWFAQNIDFDEIHVLWDVLVKTSSRKLLKVYIMIMYEILKEAAPTLTYKWSQEPSALLHELLTIRIKGIDTLVNKISKSV